MTALSSLTPEPLGETEAQKEAYRAAYDKDIRPWIVGYSIVFGAAGPLALTGPGLLILDPEADAVASRGATFTPTFAAAPGGLSLGGVVRF